MNSPDFFESLASYVTAEYQLILTALWEHVYISATALLLTIMVCIPLGVHLTRKERLAPWILKAASVIQSVPSLALLVLLIFVFGFGNSNAVAALFLYAALPVLRSTHEGVRSVPKPVVHAGRSLGMSDRQILLKIELPLAAPAILAGIRVASVWIIGTAALAATIGGGGLGHLMFDGLASSQNEVMVVGAVGATLLALGADYGVRSLSVILSPERRASSRKRRAARRSEDLPGEQTE